MTISKTFTASFFTGVLAALVLSSCGGGNTSATTPTLSSGIFTDSPVEGLTYVSGSTTGKTDAAGTFQYEVGETVTFKIGDIVLGTVTPKAVITPVTLVSAATDETNATVSNIAQFLQTIDDDNDPTNGITITTAVDTAAQGKTVNFEQSTAAFSADASVLADVATLTAVTTAGAHPIVSTAAAQAHLRSNLLAKLQGNYSGSYTGTSSGTFSVAIDGTGVITGSGAQSGATFGVSGVVGSDGTGTFGSAGVATFSGSVNPDTGAISGSWTSANGGGTYSGTKQ